MRFFCILRNSHCSNHACTYIHPRFAINLSYVQRRYRKIKASVCVNILGIHNACCFQDHQEHADIFQLIAVTFHILVCIRFRSPFIEMLIHKAMYFQRLFQFSCENSIDEIFIFVTPSTALLLEIKLFAQYSI